MTSDFSQWPAKWFNQWLNQEPNPEPLIRLNRLTQLLLLATTVMVYSVLGMAIANSLFVSYVGADHLPLAFIFIGLCSLPAYVLFSQIIDRYSRPQLFRAVLLGSIPAVLGLRLLLTQESPYGYYVLLIAVFFQWDFHNNVLYPSLLTDYFTTLEYKRYAPYIGIAQAAGTLLGGGLTAVLSHYLRTRDLLLCMPVIFIIGAVQLMYLENSQRRISVDTSHSSVGIIDSLRTFPDLVRRYPLVLFLASSSFLLVIIYISSEFLWFNIYGTQFSDQALTGFLGLMRIAISLIQVAVIYGATRPLLKTIGVAQMNPVYPLTTLASFGALLSHFGLPAAIGLHINGDALYKGINLPVHQLNYNAIPREFVGRIRTLSDGVIYAIGLTLAGVLLWLGETRLSLTQIAWAIACLTVCLLLVRLPMGYFYASSLESMIRSDSIDLNDFDLYPIQLNSQAEEAVRELLLESDRYSQLKGLELAARIEQPSQFLPEIEKLILSSESSPDDAVEAQLYEDIIALFVQCPVDLQAHFAEKLQDVTLALPLRAFALEVLLINQYVPSDDDIQSWLDHKSIEMQVLGAIAQLITTSNTAPSTPIQWPATLNNSAAHIITRIVAHSHIPRLAPLISEVVLTQTSPTIVRTGLEALGPLTQKGDIDTTNIASSKLDHYDPMVRIAALDLLRITGCEESLETITPCLGDADPRVRQQTAKTLAAFGRTGVDTAAQSLTSPRPDTVNAAITAIGLVRTKYASNQLFDYLAPSFKQLAKTRQWQPQIPGNHPNWQALSVAIADYHDRLIQRVLFILAALGHARTVNAVNRLLATNDQQELENAIEVLASLSHRRFVVPLMPLLEALVTTDKKQTTDLPAAAQVESAIGSTVTSKVTSAATLAVTAQWLKTKGYRLLLEALESSDRWIKSGALIALAMVPSALAGDPDPVVQQVASQLFEANLPARTVMNRLLLLKTVSLFKNLSLDELLLIDESLDQTHVLTGATIFTEGDLAAHLYIIAEGTVQLVKEIDEMPRGLRQLGRGDYFGEVALFDDAPLWDSAIAQTDCTLLKLEKNRFLSLITQRPHMILEICRFLTQRLRETDTYRAEQVSSVRS